MTRISLGNDRKRGRRNNTSTLEIFLSLPPSQQYSLIFSKGIFLESALGPRIVFALYSLGNFFVELEYDSLHNEFIGQKAFSTGEELDKYPPVKVELE